MASNHLGEVHVFSFDCVICKFEVSLAKRELDSRVGHELMSHHFEWQHPDFKEGRMYSGRRVTINQSRPVHRLRGTPSYLKDFCFGKELQAIQF